MIRTLSAALVLLLCLRGTALADVLYTVEELLPLPGFTTAHAYSLNDSGQVVGYSWTPVPETAPDRGAIAPMFWHENTALALAEPSAHVGYIALDINNAGQIVGMGRNLGAFPFSLPDDVTGAIDDLGSGGAGNVLWPQAGAPLIGSGPECGVQDEWTWAITDSGYKLVTQGFGIYGLVSPNLDDPLCGLTIVELYESGAALTPQGYVYDLAGQWITSPTCPDALCDEVHDKLQNASGQFIVNVGDHAFLLTPCSPFPGGGSTEGCFPGPGPFPGLPEPATLALLGIGLAGLAFSRRKRFVSFPGNRRPS